MVTDERIYVRLTRQAIEKLGGEMRLESGSVELSLPSKRIDPMFAEYLRDEHDLTNSEIEDVFEHISDITIKNVLTKAIRLSR